MDLVHLTRKQREFFDYIVEYKKENDIWPTYREIADHFGFRSPNSVTQNIQALLKKGYLIKGDEEEYDLPPDKKELLGSVDGAGIPIRGLIAAGYLQEAVEADLGQLTMNTLFPNLDKLFALRVSGFSMKDADIYDGDFVLLMDTELNSGDIGAVLYNGHPKMGSTTVCVLCQWCERSLSSLRPYPQGLGRCHSTLLPHDKGKLTL